MPVFIAPETPAGKEHWKWDHYQDETNPHDSSIKGMRPRGFQPFPAMLYKATRDEAGFLSMESRIAHDASEQERWARDGFVPGGQGAAVEALNRFEDEIAKAAAERAYAERSMSSKAQAEAKAIDDSTDRHVPVIPETPVRPKRKYTRKAQPPAVE